MSKATFTSHAAWVGLAALACAAVATPAAAHPHVWVSVETTVVYDKGAITGFRHRWTFDELYTTMAIQGLDANNDGTYDRKELAELAQVNMDGLKEFDYFTQSRLGGQPLKNGAPKDYWLEHKDGVLSLNFVLPLAQPVLAEAEGFSFAVSDPSYFIAFDLAKDQPIKLSDGAPPGCQASVVAAEQDKAEIERLGKAFQQELGGAAANFGVARQIAINCPKS
jgi:ABC-type uncharacterized transport system substrate-binding protein